MRERMHSELNKAKAGEFDAKHSRGGMVDIDQLAKKMNSSIKLIALKMVHFSTFLSLMIFITSWLLFLA